MLIVQKNRFNKFYKKVSQTNKDIIDVEINKIIADPNIGVIKKGNLSDFLIHKFKIKSQLYLLAYSIDISTITLQALGTHQNFYLKLGK